MCHAGSVPDAPSFLCPFCGYVVSTEEPGSYDICPVCGWEDDLSQLRFPTIGGANAPLIDCQREYASPRDWERRLETPEGLGYVRDPDWRPIDPAIDDVEQPLKGLDYGLTYSTDRTVYYYWRVRQSR
jgi:hypothetical protein